MVIRQHRPGRLLAAAAVVASAGYGCVAPVDEPSAMDALLADVDDDVTNTDELFAHLGIDPDSEVDTDRIRSRFDDAGESHLYGPLDDEELARAALVACGLIGQANQLGTGSSEFIARYIAAGVEAGMTDREATVALTVNGETVCPGEWAALNTR